MDASRRYLARNSAPIVSATWCISAVSQVAAMPIACGKTVAMPARATPCSPSFHQLYSGTPRRGMAGARSQLRRLLLQRHPRDEVRRPRLGAERRVAIGQSGRTGRGRSRRKGEGEARRESCPGDGRGENPELGCACSSLHGCSDFSAPPLAGLQIAVHAEPADEGVEPAGAGGFLGIHAEAVPALFVEVELDRALGRAPASIRPKPPLPNNGSSAASATNNGGASAGTVTGASGP